MRWDFRGWALIPAALTLMASGRVAGRDLPWPIKRTDTDRALMSTLEFMEFPAASKD